MKFFCRPALASLLFGLCVSSAFSADTAAPKQKFNIPPSADLSYSIKARQSGLALDGEAQLKWRTGNGTFTIETETRAMLAGKILEARSEGTIDAYGLAPGTFIEKRFRKDPTTTTFNRATNTINFASGGAPAPIKGGEQDRNSAIWQLIAIARGSSAKFKPGSEWSLIVAGAQDAERWTFKVIKQEKIKSSLGSINALHIVKAPSNNRGQQLDIWLAPSMQWYPLRLRFTEDGGDFIEQSLEKITRQ